MQTNNDLDNTIQTNNDLYNTIQTNNDLYNTIQTNNDLDNTIQTNNDLYNTIQTNKDQAPRASLKAKVAFQLSFSNSKKLCFTLTITRNTEEIVLHSYIFT